MSKIVRLEPRQPDQWKPETTKLREVEAETIKRYAREIKDWVLLDQAVEQQIEDQRRFVEWWIENVGVRQSPGGKDGGASNAERRSTVSVTKAEDVSGISQQKVSRWNIRLKDVATYRTFLRGPSYRRAMNPVRGTEGTGEFERYTPAKYVEMVRTVMGSIDLDPASCEVAQKIVKATEFFMVEDDGLSRDWHGNVFLNPPYHRDLQPKFISKLVIERLAGRVPQAIVLTNNSTDTDWFIQAQTHCTAICFAKGRVAFLEEDGVTEVGPTQGQAFSYYGENADRFCETFRTIGFIATSFVNYRP